MQSRVRLSLAKSLQLIRVFPLMNTADGIFVICRSLVQAHSNGSCLRITFPLNQNNIPQNKNRNQQMQSKYSYSQSQGDAKSCSSNVKHDSLHNSENLLFDHKPRSVFIVEPHNSKGYSFFSTFLTFLQTARVGVFLVQHNTLTTRRTAESYTVPSDFDKCNLRSV